MGKSSTSLPSPLSPTLWPTESFRWPASVGFALTLVATFFISSFAMLAIFTFFHISIGTRTHLTEYAYVLSALAELPIVLFALAFLPRLAKRSLAQLGLHPIRFRDLGYAIGGALAMIVLTAAAGSIEQYAFHLHVKENVITIFKASEPRGWVIALAIMAAIYAPLVEEIVFRGFVLNALLRYAPVGVAVVASALIFAAAHGEDPTAFFPLAMAGLVLAGVYYRTGSLVTSILTHGTFNFIELSLYLATKHT